MRPIARFCCRFACVVVLLTPALRCQPTASAVDAAIRSVMVKSADDWNRGDLKAFIHLYQNSADIIMVGPHIETGYDSVLATYRKNYATAAQRGRLAYTDLEVQPLDGTFATATGHFHLERTPVGGGNQDSYFLIVLEKTSGGWRIVRDASVLLPAKVESH